MNRNNRKYRNNRRKRESSEDFMETIQIAIKRKSVDREIVPDSGRRRARTRTMSPPAPPNVMDTEEILDLIPPFNPSSSSSLSAEQWINTVEDMREIYGWDDRLTLVYATLRLQDAAKRWNKENLFEWPEFRVKFVQHFSPRNEKTDMFEQLLRRRKENDETYENYVFGIERMALKCGCNVETTINYIISGLRDSYLKKKLIDCHCNSVDELFSRIKAFTTNDLRNQLIRRHGRNSEENESSTLVVCSKCRKIGHSGIDCSSKVAVVDERKEVHPPRSSPALKESVMKRNVMCVKCKNYGHYSKDCFFRTKFCTNCKQKGHETNECREKKWIEPDSEDCSFEIENNAHHGERNFEEVFCLNCKELGHQTKDCTLVDMLCYFCSERGHISKNCHARVQTSKKLHEESQNLSENSIPKSERRRTVFCRICRKVGHYTRDCMLSGSAHDASENVSFCRNCKLEGHYTRDCKFNDSKHSPDSEYKRNRFNEAEEISRYGSEDRRDEIFCRICRIGGHSTKDCKIIGQQLLINESYHKRTVFCRICKIGGHYTKDCKFRELERPKQNSEHTNEEFCRICKVDGHFTKDCQFKDSGHSSQNSGLRIDGFCRICKKEGHFTRECKFNNESEHSSNDPAEQRRGVSCKICKKSSHHTLDCRLRVSTNKIEGYCRICKVEGHFTRECMFNVSLTEEPTQEIEPRHKGFCRICKLEGHFTNQCKQRKFNRDVKQEVNIRDNSSKRWTKRSSHEPPAKKICIVETKTEQMHFPEEILSSTVKNNRNLSELLKPVRIDNVYVTALVNLGSDCTTLQRSEFEKHDWKMQPCHLQLNAFASGSSKTIGKISKNVCVGEVELVIDILVVEDDIQDFPLVLGSNFLDHPSVCVIKKYRSLEIKLVDSKENLVAQTPLLAEPTNDGLVAIKSEPVEDVAEDNLLQILGMMEEDCS